jgi:hypothetical protein
MALRVEMVVNRSVGSNEFMQVSHAPEADHCTFSSTHARGGALGVRVIASALPS